MLKERERKKNISMKPSELPNGFIDHVAWKEIPLKRVDCIPEGFNLFSVEPDGHCMRTVIVQEDELLQ